MSFSLHKRSWSKDVLFCDSAEWHPSNVLFSPCPSSTAWLPSSSIALPVLVKLGTTSQAVLSWDSPEQPRCCKFSFWTTSLSPCTFSIDLNCERIQIHNPQRFKKCSWRHCLEAQGWITCTVSFVQGLLYYCFWSANHHCEIQLGGNGIALGAGGTEGSLPGWRKGVGTSRETTRPSHGAGQGLTRSLEKNKVTPPYKKGKKKNRKKKKRGKKQQGKVTSPALRQVLKSPEHCSLITVSSWIAQIGLRSGCGMLLWRNDARRWQLRTKHGDSGDSKIHNIHFSYLRGSSQRVHSFDTQEWCLATEI